MQNRLPFAIVVASLLVAGCAPTTAGSRDAPVDLRTNPIVTATRASTTFVLAAFDHGAFGYTGADLAGRWIPWGPEGAAAYVTPLFSLREVVAPDGWVLEIDQVRAFDLPRRSGVAIEATLRLEVPAGARLGGQRLRAQLDARNGRSQPIVIVVQVVP
jgi:hypothetical protein